MELDKNSTQYNLIENIIKFKHIYLSEISLIKNTLYYNEQLFNIQTPIFKHYNSLSYNNKLYLQLFINNYKSNHVKFLNFIDSIELFFKNNNKTFKSQIIHDINNMSIKIKLSDDNKIFNSRKNEINILTGKPLILLIKFDINDDHYSIICNQILEI